MFDVQRWDAIRFLFLYHHGGMYVDFDSECLSPLDPLLNGHSCCLGLEPAGHAVQFKRSLIIGNALMATVPGHPFFEMIIRDLFTKPSVTLKGNKALHVIETTGPLMTTGIYDAYPRKDDIRLLPAELVAPLTIEEVRRIMEGSDMSDLEEKVEKAYAIHYFFGLWHKHLDT